jgi:acetyl esterase/lipase
MMALMAALMLFAAGAHGEDAMYKTEKDILYRPQNDELTEAMGERCRLDVYYPANQKGFATVIWFHGGGMTSGEKFIPEQLQEQGIAVVAVNYRLSPAATCPAYIDDAAAATAWTLREIGRYGGDPKKVFISGFSAGGYLAAMVGLDRKWLAKHDAEANDLAGIIPLSGQMITHFTVRAERGIRDTQPLVDEFAPLFHVRADAPPLVLITGDREIELLGRYEENAYMARMMKIAGHTRTTLRERKASTTARCRCRPIRCC